MYGDPVKGEVVTTDASLGISFLLYKAGTTTAHTLQANEFFHITDILMSTALAGTYAICFPTDAAGQRVCKGYANVLAKGELTHHFATPICGVAGVGPVFFAAVGAAACIISGYITEV